MIVKTSQRLVWTSSKVRKQSKYPNDDLQRGEELLALAEAAPEVE